MTGSNAPQARRKHFPAAFNKPIIIPGKTDSAAQGDLDSASNGGLKSEPPATAPKSSSGNRVKTYFENKLMQKVPIILEENDRGYHSTTDPNMDKISAEMYD